MAQIKLAEYTFDNSVGDVMLFLTPDTITMTKEDTVNGNITRRIVYIDNATMPTRIMFSIREPLLTVDYLNIDSNITSIQAMFFGCSSLTSVDLSSWDTSQCTNMQGVFYGCSKLETLNISNFNTKNVNNVSNMFEGCLSLKTLDLSTWDTRKVTFTNAMFQGWNNTQTVYYEPPFWSIGTTTLNSNINWVINVTRNNGYWLDMTRITGATEIKLFNENNLPTEEIITDWGDGTRNSELTHTYSTVGEYVVVSNLQLGRHENTTVRPYLVQANIYYKTSLQYLFESCTKLKTVTFTDNFIDLLNQQGTQSFFRAFNSCSSLIDTNEEQWKKLKPNDMTQTFANCASLITLDLENFDTSEVKALQYTFLNCSALTEIKGIENFDVSNVTSLNSTFKGCGIPTLNLSKWKFKDGVNMYQCFNGSKITSIDLSNVTIKSGFQELFYNCKSLETVNLSGATLAGFMQSMFSACEKLTSIDFTGATIKPTSLHGTFNNCLKLTTIDTSTWDLSDCMTLQRCFVGCSGLTSIIDIENWNVEKVTNMEGTFQACSKLELLDLSSWDVSQCTNMSGMFNGCGATSINTKGWDTSNVTNMAQMFKNMKNIVTLDLSHFDTGEVRSWSYFASGCPNLKDIDVSSFVRKSDSTGVFLFIDSPLIESVDMSNWETPESSGYYFRNNSKLKTIGMLYCSAKSINNLLSIGFQNNKLRNGITIYYYDADPSQLTPVEGVTFKKYQTPTTIQLPPHIQLHSLPDGTRDEVDIKTGILTRNVGCIILDGSEDWKHQFTVNNKQRFYINIDNMVQPQFDGDYGNLLSDYFSLTTAANTWKETVGISSSKSQSIQVYDGKCNSEDEFKVWLSTNNVKVLYQLATPTTEQLILNYNNSCDYGRILPTGMCDKYDVVNSMYTQTMASILLDGANTWDAMEEFENTVKFTATGTTVGVENLNMLGAGGLYCDNDLFPNINDDSDVEHCRVDEEGNKFYIYVDKERLMSPDLIGWQIWLQTNPFNMVYELAEHLTYVKQYEELDATQARWEGMDCMRDGTIKYHANNEDNLTIYPTLEYIAPSINNFEVPMLEPNTDYTIYAEGINANDTINLGGTDINFNNGTVYTSGDNQWLRIDNNDSFYNVVITKGDTTGEVVPYFEGMTSVENPAVCCGSIKNLFDGKFVFGSMGGEGLEDTENRLRSENYIPIQPNTKYTITCYSGYNVRYVAYYDENKNFISGTNFNPYNVMSVTTPSDNSVKYMLFNCAKNDTSENFTLDDLRNTKAQVELGGVSTEYTPPLSEVSYTDLKLRSLPNGVKDTINVVTGEYVQRVGEREYQDGDLTNENVLTDGINTMYELENYIITKLDAQTLLAYTDGTINLSSDTGLLPTTHYTVPSTNTFHLPSMKTGTRYTLKYPSASGSITIGDITYKISSDSMLFTTPLKINGDTSAIIFSDTNPENVILLEGAYNKREVPFFTGVKSVKNPNITITDQLSTESTTYNCETEIELRGLPNGVADKLDIIKGKLTTNVGIRPYQEGDENLPNIWTDGYETVYALSSPVVTNVAIDHPTVTTNSLIELSSDYLIPQLNYRAPSSNNFPLDLLQPNTTYTLYADTLASGSYTLGGTKTGIYSQPHTITLGDMTDNLLTFNGDLGLSNVMLVKGNSLKTTLPPYFLGIRSVTDGHLLVEGMAGEMNELTIDEGIVLRDCNGVKDTIDLITGTLTKRTGEITLTGAEGWYRADSESTTDYNVFKLTLGGLKEALVMCDTLQSVFDTKMMDCIHAHTNELCIVIANATIGGNTVNALKSWLNQHPTTVVYQLKVPIEVQLENVWTTTPPTSYSNQTEISSTVSTNSLKPMISVTIATTTLEEIVSNLETRNAQLEEENMATMLALTEVYEMMYTSTVDDDTEPTSVSTWNRRIIVSSIGIVYAKLVKRGVKSIENIPTKLQVEVQYAIDNGLV